MKNIVSKIATILALAVVAVYPASAITNGELDGDGHPYVGIMVAIDENGDPRWRCSGALISPTVYVTAGHCTESPAVTAEIWFAADVESGIPGNGYPFVGEVSGTAWTSPAYNPNAFFLNDLGVVLLDEPVVLDEYATLVEEAGQLNALKTRRGLQNQTFTAVGYGLQQINPVFIQAERVRMVATPHLIQINVPGFTGDFSILLSNNHSTGGTCFGDSGGPNFIGDSNVIGGVTSFGINGNCAGTGGVYRLDRQHDLEWLNDFLE